MADTSVTTPVVDEPTEGRSSVPSRWLLPVVMGGTFVAIMDSFIVNVAVPSIRSDLDASFAQVELAVSGYVLAYGLFLVTGGRLGDIHGYRRLFLGGLGLFTVASLACGLATTPAMLIAFRVVQALGAAMFYPQVLSVLQTSFSGKRRTRAFAVFGATIGGASIAGQLLGGLLVERDLFGLSWRPVFLVNVPIGVLLLIGAAFTVPQLRGAERTRLDLRGMLLLTLALLLLSVPLVEGHAAGWPAWTWIMLALSLPAFGAFVSYERALAGRGGHALVPPALFRRRAFSGGTVIALAFFAGNAGLFFVLTLYLQNGLGYSPLLAGLSFLPLAALFVVASLIAPRLQARIGGHGGAVLVLGYLINAVGTLALLATAVFAGTEATGLALLPALAVIGFGEGLGVSPLFGTVLGEVPAQDAGSASGVLETAGQIGMSLGVTVVGLVFFTSLGTGSGNESGTGTGPGDYSGAFTAGLVANAVLALTALFLVPRLVRPGSTARAATSGDRPR